LLKLLFVSLTLVSTLAFAVPKELPDGSLVFSPQDIAQLQDEVNLLLQQVYKAGVADGSEAVKSNPKLCPKDI
jgi:hypothetical protein